MTDETTAVPEDREFVGYGPAAEYLGLKRNTLSSYVARGIGPEVARKEIRDQYVLPVFTLSALQTWRDARPGQGARTDLAPAAIAA
jgi:hypothetical protein